VPVTLVPLDVTLRCRADTAWLDALATTAPAYAVLVDVFEHTRGAFRTLHGADGIELHDALAVLEAVVPGTLGTTPLPLRVVTGAGPGRGVVLVDDSPDHRADGAPRVRVAVDVEPAAVLDEVLRRLRDRAGPAAAPG
jgi:pyrimidine-specific ribonucleoside hydrolase